MEQWKLKLNNIDMAQKEQKYEEVFAELEALVASIEKPDKALADVEKDVKKALEKIAWCKEYLRADKERIDKMLE